MKELVHWTGEIYSHLGFAMGVLEGLEMSVCKDNQSIINAISRLERAAVILMDEIIARPDDKLKPLGHLQSEDQT